MSGPRGTSSKPSGFNRSGRRRFFATLVLSLLALGPGGCDSRTITVRYRVTMVVDDAGIQRAASNVWSFSLKRVGIPLASPYHGRFQGDPIAMKLSDGRTLFLLTSGRYGPELAASFPENLFGDEFTGKPSDRLGKMTTIATKPGAHRSLPCDYSKRAVYLNYPLERAAEPCLLLALAPAGQPSNITERRDLHGEHHLSITNVDIEIINRSNVRNSANARFRDPHAD